MNAFLPYMKRFFLLLTVFLLAACNSAVSNAENTSSAASEDSVFSASSAQSSSSPEALSYEQALPNVFTSERLGIDVRFPSVMYDMDCGRELPVVAEEKEFTITFTPTELLNGDCAVIMDAVGKEERAKQFQATIHVQRAKSSDEVRQFIDRVFSPDCLITEENEYNGTNFMFLASKNPPKDEPDFLCSETVRWNKEKGVVLFSSLGSKNGGGIEWGSAKPFLMPDGSIEYSFDYAVMQSIRYLEP
jgi:hypothetical protein